MAKETGNKFYDELKQALIDAHKAEVELQELKAPDSAVFNKAVLAVRKVSTKAMIYEEQAVFAARQMHKGLQSKKG